MFYLFHGPDTYSQREFLAGLLAKEGDADMLSLNTTRLSGKVTFNELQSACDAMPFLAEPGPWPLRRGLDVDSFL